MTKQTDRLALMAWIDETLDGFPQGIELQRLYLIAMRKWGTHPQSIMQILKPQIALGELLFDGVVVKKVCAVKKSQAEIEADEVLGRRSV